jgi:hypothetical protein
MTVTTSEVDAAREAGQAAAKRTDGSAEECPHRLLGAVDKVHTLELARLWLLAFNECRAWMREHPEASEPARVRKSRTGETK